MEIIRRLICTFVWTMQGTFFGVCLEKMLPVNDDACSRAGRTWLWSGFMLVVGAMHSFALPGPWQMVSLGLQCVVAPLLLYRCYQGRFLTRLAAFVCLYAIPMALDVLFSPLILVLMGRSPAEHYASMDSSYVLNVIALQLTAFALQGVACTIWCRRRQDSASAHHTPYLLGIALVGICILFSSVFGVDDSVSGGREIYMVMVTSIFFVACASVFVLVNQAEKETLSKALADTRRVSELERVHYGEIESRRAELSALRQSYRRTLDTVLTCLETGDLEQAEGLLNELSVRIAATRESPFCSVPIINAILTEKQQTCQQSGIDLRCDLLLPDSLEVQNLDLCSAFSNLMDNAIRACKKEPLPQITLSCRVVQGYLVIKCANPAAKAPGAKPEGTGYGLKILADIARRYHGNFSTEYKNKTFTAQLSLLAAEKGEQA
ncbi:MAG: GHKL domain-containing protein [Eubacteriales bacterium]|nr:GHKL domain-containing protein [Eubacteriales bacterium]